MVTYVVQFALQLSTFQEVTQSCENVRIGDHGGVQVRPGHKVVGTWRTSCLFWPIRLDTGSARNVCSN